jgi:heme/copper-type cytochrome/quinol oxidase subunit 3
VSETRTTLAARARTLPAGWWGMALLIATEATIFGSLIASYFFLRIEASEWPMGGLKAPDVLMPTVLTAALVATSIPMVLAASAALRGHTARAWWAIAVAVTIQCAYMAIQLVTFVDDLDSVPPTANAYASAYTTLLGVHHAHVLVGIALGIWLLGRLAIGGLTRYRVDAVRNVAWYVHFVNAMAILVLLTELSPRL